MPLDASMVPDVVRPTCATCMKEPSVGTDITEAEIGPFVRRLSLGGAFARSVKLKLRVFRVPGAIEMEQFSIRAQIV